MVEEVGGTCYHHFHRNHTWVGKCHVGSGRFCVGTKAAKWAVSHGKKTAFAYEARKARREGSRSKRRSNTGSSVKKKREARNARKEERKSERRCKVGRSVKMKREWEEGSEKKTCCRCIFEVDLGTIS